MVWWVTLALLISAASAARHGRAHAVTKESSLRQIHDTLQNLKKSVEDSRRAADSLYSGRQQWCDGSLPNLTRGGEAASLSLRRMEIEVEERAAEAEEAEGSALQLRAEIDIARHTLKKVTELQREWGNSTGEALLLSSLVRNKQQTVATLEGEEEVVLPRVAQLQAGVVDMRVRLADQRDSVAKEGQFTAVLKEVCAGSASRAEVQVTAHAKTAGSIDAAIRGLQQIASQPTAVPAQQPPLDLGLQPTEGVLSFLQQAEQSVGESEEDLLEVFGARSPSEEPQRRSAKREATQAAAPERPKIKRLLAELREQQRPQDGRKAWCAEEQLVNERIVLLARASAGEMAAEVDAHAEASRQVTQRLQDVQAGLRAQGSAIEHLNSSLVQEQALATTHLKDQTLATRILQQALEVLEDLRASGLPEPEERVARNLTAALEAAEAAFRAQAQVLPGHRKEAGAAVQALLGAVREAGAALEHERGNLALAQDSHTAEMRRCARSRATCASEAKDASQFLQSLQNECRVDVHALEERERAAELWALEDSDAVLDGRLPAARDGLLGSPGLRGTTETKTARPLSPLQRAAAEMGVAFDGN